MPNIGDAERITQNRVIKFFHEKLHYTYLGDLSDKDNSNVIVDLLRKNLLARGYSEGLTEKAIVEFLRRVIDLSQDLYKANEDIYSYLKYGIKVAENAGESPKTVYLIDFDDLTKNDYYVAEEVSIPGDNTKRPDVVVYINGIAIAVIELKKSTVSVSNGIRQNLTNQKAHFIRPFFSTIQFCMAGNDSEGLRYGTILTPEKHYLEWRQDDYAGNPDELDESDLLIRDTCAGIENKLDSQIYAMFYKKRFLDLIHNFIIFDKGIKKVCRYNQYYAIKRAEHRIMGKRGGGIVWHTQGSGKSLTMVWLSKWLLSNDAEGRVLIVTDRDELDDQIEKLFLGVGEKIIRTKSCKDLVNRLNSVEDRLLCSLVHKFGKRGGEASEKDYDAFVEELNKSLPPDFSAKGNLYVFVDECHRTQSGKLHAAMTAIMPKAIFVGFTGTPLLKKDKKTSLEVFGGYIHTYKFNEAVRDGVVLDLRYEARDIPQDITSQSSIDAWFDAKTAGLSARGKAKLKQLWGTMQAVHSSKARLEKIAKDIVFDFNTIARLSDDNGGNAILVADSVYNACKYYEIFQNLGFRRCAVISSYSPQAGDLRTDTVSDTEDTETFEKYEIYRKMVGIGEGDDATSVAAAVENFEKEAKRKFVEEPAQMKLLIVVDKLLTGFDAPPCTYLYIDKAMHDHGLFQAICRVNRLDSNQDEDSPIYKDFGYIVDYRELFGDIADAMNKYTSSAFEAYDAEDVEGLLKDRTDEARKFFEDTLDELDGLCEGVELPREELNYIRYFCGENGVDDDSDEAFSRSREKLYRLVSRLSRAYAEVKQYMDKIGYTADQRAKFENRVSFYIQLKDTIGRASADFIDLKMYEPGMRYLIDNYIEAGNATKLEIFEDFTLLDFILSQEEKLDTDAPDSPAESAAEAIENNIRKKIVQKIIINPAYYGKMSEVLEQLIFDRKKGAVQYKQLLQKYIELAKNVTKPDQNSRYPDSIKASGALRAFYDNCGEDETLALKIHKAVLSSKQDGFRGNLVKMRKIKAALYKLLKDEDEVERVYNIVVEQEEY